MDRDSIGGDKDILNESCEKKKRVRKAQDMFGAQDTVEFFWSAEHIQGIPKVLVQLKAL